LYHVTPLQYLPHIVHSGALYPKSVLATYGIRPRQTAVRRDRMLGLADWVHLSLRPATPLLRDKLEQGYPHALLVFDRDALLALPEVALLPYNTKAWRSRAACQPVTDPAEKREMLRRHGEAGQFPSLEVLVHYGLDLALLIQIAFASEEERLWVSELLASLNLTAPASLQALPDLFPAPDDYQPVTRAAIIAYFTACCEAGRLLPLPAIPFD
jgi:hypothetical protein